MNQQNAINQIDESLKDLHDSFNLYQKKQEEKMNQYQAALNRLPSYSSETQGDQDFLSFVRKGLSQKSLTSTDRGGAFLIPSYLIQKIHQRLSDSSSIRSLASVIDITTDAYDVLVEKGQTDVGWAQESDSRNETELPELLKIQIPTHEIYARPRASQKILDDSAINIEQWIYGKICESMSRLENEAFIKGDGLSKPKGIIPYVQNCSIESMQDKLSTADALIETINKLRTEYLQDSVWMMSRSAYAAIRLMKDPATQRYLLQPALDQSMPTTILGFPVFLSDALDTVKDGAIPILFGNFKKGYQIVDRKDISLLRDPFSAKPFVEFYATKRVGGDVIDPDAIKAIQIKI